MKYLIILLVLFSSCLGKSQITENEQYHAIEFTTSSVKLLEFNIQTTDGKAYVKETIDSLNRTAKLEFFNWKGELGWAGSGFYGGSIIKYEYSENKIIETFFSDESEIFNDFQWSEAPYRFEYTLNDEGDLTKVKSVYKIDFEFNTESIDSTISHLKFYRKFAPNTSEETMDVDHVFGYTYAIAKLDGKHPKLKKE